MITQRDIIADMHTHTVASSHAYSTVRENILTAETNGLSYIAVTDHYYHDGTNIQQRNEMSRIMDIRRVNMIEKDVYVIGGAEFNIGQELEYWDKLQTLKWRPIGLHSWYYDIENNDFDDLYNQFEEASKRHNCFVHIERSLDNLNHGKYKTDILGNPVKVHNEFKLWVEAICILAKKKDVFMEINECSMSMHEEKMRYWVEFAKRNGNMISLGTDAHYCLEVGSFEKTLRLLNEVNYPKELILNCNEDLLNSFR